MYTLGAVWLLGFFYECWDMSGLCVDLLLKGNKHCVYEDCSFLYSHTTSSCDCKCV